MPITSNYVPDGDGTLPHSTNDDVIYEKDGEVRVGTVVEYILSSNASETADLGSKRSSTDTIEVRVKKWSYVSGLNVTAEGSQQHATSRKMPGLSSSTDSDDEHDTISTTAITDYAIILNYKIFEDEYSFLYGVDNMHVTDDEKHMRPIGATSQMVLLGASMMAVLTSRLMSNTGQLQKDRKYLSIPGFDDACWRHMHRKCWHCLAVGLFDDDAEADKRKREKESVVRRNVTMIQNTATLDRLKTIERNAVLQRIACYNDEQVAAVVRF